LFRKVALAGKLPTPEKRKGFLGKGERKQRWSHSARETRLIL